MKKNHDVDYYSFDLSKDFKKFIIKNIIKSERRESIITGAITAGVLFVIDIARVLIFGADILKILAMIIGGILGVSFWTTVTYMISTREERAILKEYKKEEKENSKKNRKNLTKSISKNKDVKEIENMIEKEFEVKSANLRNRADDIETLKEVKKLLHNDLQNNDIVKQHVKRK